MKKTRGKHVVVIMAGGAGTRLWPLSRKGQPKQFHAFLSEKTLLEETYDRARQIVPKTHIFISTNENYRDRIRKILPDFPDNRMILEPIPRGTAPAISLISAFIAKKHPGAIVATVASDHAIENDDAFAEAIKTGLETIAENPEKLAIVGINPTSPDTGLGYIRMGKRFSDTNSREIFFVDEFKEKPDQKTAESYLSDWRYLWNAGYFIFSAETMLDWIRKKSRKTAEITEKIASLSGMISAESKAETNMEYSRIPNEAIEPLVVEKLPVRSRVVIPAPIKWSDIGSWGSLYEFFRNRHGSESFVLGDCIEYDGKGNLIYGTKKRVVTTFGVKDLVIVDTDDALLIADRHQSGDIKKLIAELEKRDRHDLL